MRNRRLIVHTKYSQLDSLNMTESIKVMESRATADLSFVEQVRYVARDGQVTVFFRSLDEMHGHDAILCRSTRAICPNKAKAGAS